MQRSKRIDLLVLLLISFFVVGASASIYNYMYMQALPVGVQSAYIAFATGSDASSTIGTNNTWAQITSMVGWPNATRVYEDALRIQNTAGVPHDMELMFDSWSGQTANVMSIYVRICSSVGGTQQGSTLSVTAQNSTGTITVPATTTYYVQWEIRWNGNALSTDTVSVTLKLRVP